jgi:hypothetical protein
MMIFSAIPIMLGQQGYGEMMIWFGEKILAPFNSRK